LYCESPDCEIVKSLSEFTISCGRQTSPISTEHGPKTGADERLRRIHDMHPFN
jgi:hypothetical protein